MEVYLKSLQPTMEFFIQEHILETLLGVIWILYFWDQYLSFRQRRLMKKLVDPPSSLDGILSAEVYRKSRCYDLDKSNFSIIHDFYSNLINTIVMWYGGFYYCWIWGEGLITWLNLDKDNELLLSAGCIFVMVTLSTLIDLPFGVYGTFVLEERHGFNNQTAWFFIRDRTLKFVVSQILVVPLICGMIWIVKNGGDYFFFYLWIFTVVMSLVMMVIYPEVIAPLFDKYTPLPEGDLKVQIEALASSLKFPLKKLYVVDGSKRSSHSNAYLYGFFNNKRIVLFDTLIAEFNQMKKRAEEKQKEIGEATKEKAELLEKSEKETQKEEKEPSEKNDNPEKPERGCQTDEIIAVLAHELGHWHHNHTLKCFFFAQISFVFNFAPFVLLLNYTPLYEAFGFRDSQPVLIGLLIVMMYVLAPLNTLISWLSSMKSRSFEFQADRFALNLGHSDALSRALIKLHKDNLGYPLYDKLYSNWHLSHPPLLERLDALTKDN